MFGLCKYRDIFGKPGQGVHSYRLFHVAIVDVLLTILGAYMISIYWHVAFAKILVLLFVLGIIMHRIFCVKTTVDKLLFQ